MAKKVRGYRRYPVGMKQQVVGRMQTGENVKALASELGINRTLLYVWKRNAAGQAYGIAADGPQDLRDQGIRELEAKWRNWKARWAAGGRKSIFSGQPCAGSRCYASRKAGVARGRLRRDPQTGRSARRIECGVDVPIGWDEPGQFLAALGAGGAGRGRSGLAGCDPAGRGAASLLWVSPDSGADRAGGFSGRSQEGPAADARR